MTIADPMSAPVSPWALSPWKRLIDVAASFTGLLLLAPALLFVALAVRIALGSPILFRQRRPGLRGEPIRLIKFRSMTDARRSDGSLRDDDERLGRFGQWLRASSLDELPELWNVLCGDMSLVGPRPLLESYLPLYSPRQRRRHLVRPGLTGWAQVNGRNAISWNDRLEFDVWYAEHASLGIDLRILLRTLTAVVSAHGVSAPGHATMPVFEGNAPAPRSDEPPSSPRPLTAVHYEDLGVRS